MDTLVQIYENTSEFNAATRSEAEGLFNKFDSFDTLATLLLFDDLFKILAPLNLSLQARSIDLLVAMSVVDNASKKLQLLRNSAAQDMIGKRVETFINRISSQTSTQEEKADTGLGCR